MRPLPILLLLSLHLRTAPALPGIGSTQTSLFHGFEVMTYLQRDPLTGELLSFEPEPMMAQAVESTGSRIVGRQVGAVTKQVVCQWSPDAPLVVDVKTLADYLANPANVNIVLVQSSPGLKPASVDDCYSLSSKDYYHLFTLAAPATASNPRTPLLSLSLCGKPGNYIPTSTAARHLHDLIRDCTLDDRVAGRVYVRPDEVGGRGEIAVAVWRPVVDGGAVESETGEKEEEDGGGSPMQAQRFAVAGVQRQGSRQDVLVGGVGSGPYTRRL
ncbi:hypothetical protein EX30DRAFT_373778 [Ascodesmis nigricans]|uniref:Uncharacterized protein n=1 Tax=Ascodesmis nigricans TaxID=341454 RepID=A0A4S2MNL4_9PEZI|nr:hypothetical protein EX30DRAFT_373778 [Ascodesmis nigricans]